MLVAFIIMKDNYSYNKFSKLSYIKMAMGKVGEVGCFLKNILKNELCHKIYKIH